MLLIYKKEEEKQVKKFLAQALHEPPYSLHELIEKYNLGVYYGGHCSEWQWKYDNLQKLSIEDLVLLYNTINQEKYKEKLYYAKDKSKVKVDFTMLDVRKDFIDLKELEKVDNE